MDVARALYQDMTGQPVFPSLTPEGRKWIVEDVDLVSSIRYYRDGKFTLRQWINSFRAIQETTFLSCDDPWPIVGACLLDAKHALTGALGVRRRRLQPDQNGTVATHVGAITNVVSQIDESITPAQLNNERRLEGQPASSRPEP